MTYKSAKVYSGSEWVDIAVAVADANQRNIGNITGTTYTLVLSDAGKALVFSNANPVTVTIPEESLVSFDIGQTIMLIQTGLGQVSVAGAAGVTIRSANNYLNISSQYGEARLIKIASNEWVLSGDLSV